MDLKHREIPTPPPPKAATDAELEAAGYKLDAQPLNNANCGSSASSQSKTNGSWNKDLWARYESALASYKSQPQGREEPPAPRQPLLTDDFESGAPYYRLEDAHAIETICRNDKAVPYNKADDSWNYNATKFS